MSNCSEDTGVDELGYAARTPWQPCVSAKWREQQLKHAFSITLGKMLQNGPTASGDVEVPYLKAQHVQWDEIRVFDLPRMWASPAEIDALQLRKGDLLVCEGGDVGRSTILRSLPQDPTIIQNALHVVRGRNGADPRFLAYVLRHAAYQGWFEVVCNRSTIRHFTVEKFGEMRAWLPDATEQRAIADYLDRATARLDALVAAKERLLDLLAEKRRALITRAVTRGLAPNVPLRDSGIPWLGKIPAHWEIWKLGHSASVGNGSTPSRGNVAYWSEGKIPWLNSSVVNHPEVTRADQFVTGLAAQECHLPWVKRGSVLVAITGQGKTRGRAAVLSFDATINQHLAFIHPKQSRLLPWFLKWILFAAYDFLRSISDDAGGTKGALTCEEVANLRVPVPPVREQAVILGNIASSVKRLDTLLAVAENTILLIKERRSALIASAVIGKIEMRNGEAVQRAPSTSNPGK